MMISIKTQGLTMTKCIYDFDNKYNTQEIDGFPESSIEILELHYGKKRLKKMKFKTLYNKVFTLQRQLTTDPSKEHIIEAIELYIN